MKQLYALRKILFMAEAISKGGRSGTIQAPDQLLNCSYSKALRGDTTVKLVVD